MKERMFFKIFGWVIWMMIKIQIWWFDKKVKVADKASNVWIFSCHFWCISDIKIFFIWINVSQILLESVNINGYIIFFLGKPITWNQISKEDRTEKSDKLVFKNKPLF